MGIDRTTTAHTPIGTRFDRLLNALGQGIRRIGLPAYVLGGPVFCGGLFALVYPRIGANLDSLLTLILGVAFVACLQITVGIAALRSHHHHREFSRLRDGEAWAVWHYTANERCQIAQAGYYRADLAHLNAGLFRLLPGFAIVIVVMAIGGLVAIGLAIAIGTGLLLLPLLLPLYNHAHRRRVAHSTGLREVIVGPCGISENGVYSSYKELGGPFVTDITIEQGNPAVLRFARGWRYRHPHSHTYTIRPGLTLFVAIPGGREEEAAALLPRLRATLKATR